MPQLFIACFNNQTITTMKPENIKPERQNIDNKIIDNKIGYNFFIRSANSFVFDLSDLTNQVQDFPTQQLFQIVANCDHVINKVRAFKEELERRVVK